MAHDTGYLQRQCYTKCTDAITVSRMLHTSQYTKALCAHQHKFPGLDITFGGGLVWEGEVLQWKFC